MIQVKEIITLSKGDHFQNEINEFLKENKISSNRLIDIKYVVHVSDKSLVNKRALIIYDKI